MDGSSSIGRCEFERGRAAMMNLILARLSKWRRPDEKFAAVTFSNSASVNFKFLPLSAVRQQLRNISYPGGGSNTQAGLEMAKTLFQDSSAGEINNIKHAIIKQEGYNRRLNHTQKHKWNCPIGSTLSIITIILIIIIIIIIIIIGQSSEKIDVRL